MHISETFHLKAFECTSFIMAHWIMQKISALKRIHSSLTKTKPGWSKAWAPKYAAANKQEVNAETMKGISKMCAA